MRNLVLKVTLLIYTDRPDAIPRELVERHPFFQSVSRLRVLDCFLVGDPRYWPADEVRGRVLPPPLLPTEDGPDLEPEEINARFLDLFDALRMRERGEREDQGAG
jgi:hypothetical protein